MCADDGLPTGTAVRTPCGRQFRGAGSARLGRSYLYRLTCSSIVTRGRYVIRDVRPTSPFKNFSFRDSNQKDGVSKDLHPRSRRSGFRRCVEEPVGRGDSLRPFCATTPGIAGRGDGSKTGLGPGRAPCLRLADGSSTFNGSGCSVSNRNLLLRGVSICLTEPRRTYKRLFSEPPDTT